MPQTQQTADSARRLAYTIHYRIAGDGRSLAQAACMITHRPIDVERAEMTTQGYEFLRVTVAEACEKCDGRGQIKRQIKNGRRKGPLMAFKTCPACAGVGWINETVIEERI